VNRRKKIAFSVAVLVVLGVLITFFLPWRDYAETFLARRFISDSERPLLYHVNHLTLAAELRRFAADQRWKNSISSSDPQSFDPADPAIPPSLRVLKPSLITIYDDRIEYDFGSALFDFGIVVFKEGIPGTGTKQLGDGIWFYSQDGQIPPD
jgi:hypothetical protein